MTKRRHDNWRYFEKQHDLPRNHQWWKIRCKACIEAYQNMGLDGYGAVSEPETLESRPAKMAKHVEECRHIAAQLDRQRVRQEERADAEQTAREEHEQPRTSIRPHVEHVAAAPIKTRPLVDSKISPYFDRDLSRHEVETFHRLLLDVTVDANIPMSWVGFVGILGSSHDGTWVVRGDKLSARQSAAWRTLEAHLKTLGQAEAIEALDTVRRSIKDDSEALAQQVREINKNKRLKGMNSASSEASTAPAARSTAAAASSKPFVASKDDSKPKRALRTPQKTLIMDLDAPIKSAAPMPQSFESPGPAVAPMAGATHAHQVNSTPPTPMRAATPQSLPPRTPIRATTRTPQSMPPPHREAVPSYLDDDLPGPLPLSQSTGSSESSQEINMPLSARSPVPMSVRASVPPTPAPALPAPATLDTLQTAMMASEKKILACIDARINRMDKEVQARFNRMNKEVQAIRRRVDGGGIEEHIERVALDERPNSNNDVQQDAATDILRTFLADMKASLADNEAKVDIAAIRHSLADLSDQLQAADVASRAANIESRTAILERLDGVSQELEAARRATAKTILESKRLEMPTSFIFTEHRIDPNNPVLQESSEKFLAGECGGFLYIVDERTGLPVLDKASKTYPMPITPPSSERLKFICSLLGPCECGVKFMKAAKTVANVVPGLGVLVPILETALNGLKAAVKDLQFNKDELSRTFVEFVRKGDPEGNYDGVVQHARDDGTVMWARPLDVQATHIANEPAAPGPNDA
ncbi:hypothetical protein SDRG_01808 [Saprolegnia diclina VS20]|uniref:Uncharacterized protein n=1 Tax=Saprolegnia diclina (strain VS20) TaxID=1156394 RepID=T0R1A3_SAPDV|nr:hypothetical protein SDRG_01808 [Saprolegnia diclina VS20]EQC40736.1 hypothetical protein SDRG_01808 [Saprolegnia diclina VS20]|eukprot:XP_008605580.1 hypothetical protein SDRG_01808 [Saprolegnia diclina VS20]